MYTLLFTKEDSEIYILSEKSVSGSGLLMSGELFAKWEHYAFSSIPYGF